MTQICRKITLREATNTADMVTIQAGVWCDRILTCGSVRRGIREVGDIDFVVMVDRLNWNRLCANMLMYSGVSKVLGGDKVFRIIYPCVSGQVQVDFYRATEKNWGAMVVCRTGSAEFNVWLAKRALKAGLRFQPSIGVTRKGEAIAGEDEEGVFEALGLPFIEPKFREVVDGIPVWGVLNESIRSEKRCQK